MELRGREAESFERNLMNAHHRACAAELGDSEPNAVVLERLMPVRCPTCERDYAYLLSVQYGGYLDWDAVAARVRREASVGQRLRHLLTGKW